MADDKDWKTKYFNSLQQLEDMETTWYKLETLLRKAITRLAITAKGIDAQLDKVLQKIQQHSRQKEDEALSSDLEELSSLLAKIDETLPAYNAPSEASLSEDKGPEIHDLLLQLIDQLRIDTDYKTRIEEFKASIHNMDSNQCLHSLADIINQLLQHEPEDKVSAQAILVTLIEKISLIHGNTTLLDAIQEKLEANFDINEWGDYLDEIISEIHLLIRGINHEKLDLESIIVDVTRQLNEISDVLTDEQSDTFAGRKDSQHLQAIMSQSVESIQAEVNQATDISRLKARINDNLVSIKSGVETFISRDNERYKKAEQRNIKLQQQIKFMEQESDQLHRRLSENRQKLMFDTLTGVRSRLSYDEILEQEFSRWSRYQDTFSFAVLDIDHFKHVNDHFGHNAGDKALQIVAKMMSRHIRKTDFLFRIGGEEFVLLLPKTSLENAVPLVEKIRGSVGASGFHFKQEKVDITLSAGLTAIQTGDTVESIYERADEALYEAKNAGRNQLIVKAG